MASFYHHIILDKVKPARYHVLIDKQWAYQAHWGKRMVYELLRGTGCIYCGGEECGDEYYLAPLDNIDASSDEEAIEKARFIAYKNGFLEGGAWDRLQLQRDDIAIGEL